MCLQLHSLDHALGQFFAGLDRRGLDYVVVLTADHGGTDIPERLAVDPPRTRSTPAQKPRGAAINTLTERPVQHWERHVSLRLQP